ncbi:MAG: AAA family ATPase [Candidatus Rokubacteria bacterium]|nr:AAA family ATPase [Candidatus Rokubacteria bacterium]
MRRLEPEELRAVCDPASLRFRSTEELPPLEGMIGQERALSATTFGIGVRHVGYNLFVLGPPATGKTTAMRRLLARAAQDEPGPPDHCYVHNFTDAYRPTAIEVPAGRGRELSDEMARLVEECKVRLPRAFEGEEFGRQKSKILEDLARRQEAELVRLEEKARAAGFALIRTPTGMAVAPAPRGKALSQEEFEALAEPARERIAAAAGQLEAQVETTLRQLRQYEREARQAHETLVSEVAASATRQLIRELRERFAGLDGVQRYLDDVEKDLIAHAEEFRGAGEGKPALPFLPPPGAFLDRYRVNVLVDRTGARGAPVVFEQNPTYGNLVGRIEHRAHFGALVTDFALIRSGALHRANGGYLILEAKDVLRNFQAWEALKKALKSRAVRIEDPLEEFRAATAAGLAPEPIPLAVKVVLIGNPLFYYLLYNLDEDFGELFKVKVDFDDSLARTPETELLYARFIAGACREDGLRPFGADGVARLIEHGSRMVAHQGRLSSRLGTLVDLIRDASFHAGARGHAGVTAEDVSHAIAQKIYRSNLIEERIGRMIAEGTLLIATDGEAVGQVNGISVLATGDHAFGRPARITVRTFSGEPGVVDIEREAKLGGPAHSKGVMILTGFLAGRYARERPLALSASITFEQHYEEIEGDSASSAELYALLSSLAGIPLAQSIAVTGSVNQRGEIQAVGGINEKIEGFFDVCRARGLDGRHGVMIPETNVRHLMLREDVVRAVREGKFNVHAVGSVDEGLEVLSGRPAGARRPDGAFPEGSFNAAVERALAENVERLKALRADSDGAGTSRHRAG